MLNSNRMGVAQTCSASAEIESRDGSSESSECSVPEASSTNLSVAREVFSHYNNEYSAWGCVWGSTPYEL